MGQTRRRYSREFKVEAVRQLHDGRRLADVARELGVNATVIRRWKDQVAVDAATAFPGNYQAVVEQHYRYSQYYGNTLVALVFSYVAYLMAQRSLPWDRIGVFTAVLGTAILLFSGSRDQLKKYGDRAKSVLD